MSHMAVDVQLHAFLTSTLDGGKWSLHASASFPVEGYPDTHSVWGWIDAPTYMPLKALYLTDQLNNSMEQSSSWDLIVAQLVKKFPTFYAARRFHYRVPKSPSVVPVLSEKHPRTFPPYFPKIKFNIISHLRLDLSISLFPSGLPTKILHAFLIHYVVHASPIASSLTWSL
jgi:hypothetical protein